MLFRFGDFTVDTRRFALLRGRERVEIAPQALEFLIYLIERRDRLVSKDELHEAFWDGRFVSEAALSTLVKAARSAVGDNGRDQKVIETEHGRGFRFRAPVEVSEQDGRVPGPLQERPPLASIGEQPAIAVLPFTNISRSDADGPLVDGIAEEIIAALARFRWFVVFSRGTTLKWRNQPVDPRAVATELACQYVVEGSVMREGDIVRVHARLIDATDGAQIWGTRQDFSFNSLFSALDAIAAHIVGAIQPRLLDSEHRRALRTEPADRTAWLLFVEAHTLLSAPGRAENHRARDLLIRSLERDPSSARAMAALALTHLWDLFFAWNEDAAQSFAGAFQAASRAVTIGGEPDAWALTALAACKLLLRDHDGAMAYHRQAIEQDPNSALAHGVMALTQTFCGDDEEALRTAARAKRLGPGDPRAAIWLNAESLALFSLGQYAEALVSAREVTAMRPDYPAGWRLVGASASRLGLEEEASRAMQKLLRIIPNHTTKQVLAAMPFKLRQHAEAYVESLAKAGLPTE